MADFFTIAFYVMSLGVCLAATDKMLKENGLNSYTWFPAMLFGFCGFVPVINTIVALGLLPHLLDGSALGRRPRGGG